jgi:hypothetical protein
MITLSQHGLNHPYLQVWIASQNWQAIADWYDEIPQPEVNSLMEWMDFSDRVKFYRLGVFREWYSDFCQKILDNTHIKPVLIFDDATIKSMAKSIAVEVNVHRLAAVNFTEVVQNLFGRISGSEVTGQTLFYLLICLISDGVFGSYTGLIYFVEMQPNKRWQNMGLMQAPTVSEIEVALSV